MASDVRGLQRGFNYTSVTPDYTGEGVNDKHTNNMQLMRLMLQTGRLGLNPRLIAAARDAEWLKPGVITRNMQYADRSLGGSSSM